MKTLAYLQAFATVAGARNFSKAALKLGLPKSTVSRQIKAIENELGVKLIHRDSRHFTLTEQGSALLKNTQVILQQAEVAFDDVRAVHAGLRGSIYITTTADLATLYLAKPIARFSKLHPEVTLDIDVNPLLVDLKTDKVDLAIRPGPLQDSSLFSRKLDEAGIGLFASPDYLKQRGHPKNVAELINHNLIATSPFKIGSEVLVPQLKANSMTMIKSLVLNSAGIGYVLTQVVHAEKKAHQVVQLFPHMDLPKVPIFLVFPDKKLPKRVDSLVKEISQQTRHF